MYQYQRPGVVFWYTLYCWLNIISAVFVAIFGCVLVLMPDLIPPSEEMMDFGEGPDVLMTGVTYALVGVISGMLHAASVLLPRSHGTWLLSLVLIAIGMLNCCCLPVLVPLIWGWLNKATQDWYTYG